MLISDQVRNRVTGSYRGVLWPLTARKGGIRRLLLEFEDLHQGGYNSAWVACIQSIWSRLMISTKIPFLLDLRKSLKPFLIFCCCCVAFSFTAATIEASGPINEILFFAACGSLFFVFALKYFNQYCRWKYEYYFESVVSSAVFGFAAKLTALEKPITLSCTHSASEAAELAGDFVRDYSCIPEDDIQLDLFSIPNRHKVATMLSSKISTSIYNGTYGRPGQPNLTTLSHILHLPSCEFSVDVTEMFKRYLFNE